MAKIDETKERISYLKNFLTITLGALVITIGGLVNLHLAGKIGLVFWIGILVVAVLLYAAWRIMTHIEKHLKKLGEL
jgi:amino acid permease